MVKDVKNSTPRGGRRSQGHRTSNRNAPTYGMTMAWMYEEAEKHAPKKRPRDSSPSPSVTKKSKVEEKRRAEPEQALATPPFSQKSMEPLRDGDRTVQARKAEIQDTVRKPVEDRSMPVPGTSTDTRSDTRTGNRTLHRHVSLSVEHSDDVRDVQTQSADEGKTSKGEGCVTPKHVQINPLFLRMSPATSAVPNSVSKNCRDPASPRNVNRQDHGGEDPDAVETKKESDKGNDEFDNLGVKSNR